MRERSPLPRRVLMTADAVGGVWTYAIDLSRALAERGVRVALATMGAPPAPDQERDALAIPGLELFAGEFRLEWQADPWADVERAGEWLLELESRVRPDVVHLNGYAHGALPWQAPRIVVGHSCVVSWWHAVHGGPPPPEWGRYRDEVAAGLRAADAVFAPTHAMRAELERHYGPLPRGGVIWNGRDSHLFRPAPKENFVLAVGRLWDEAKNVGALAKLAPELPWPVLVAGEESHPDGTGAVLAGARPLGRLPPAELAGWFARAAVYALPARYEPFGLSAVEAGLSGCALVLGDIPSLREVWGEAALFVPPEDGGALRAALGELMADPARRRELAARAGRKAREYTPERTAAGYLAAYRELLAPRGARDEPVGVDDRRPGG
jgi:glycosyltransferase involved in cell wall biosynthesis